MLDITSNGTFPFPGTLQDVRGSGSNVVQVSFGAGVTAANVLIQGRLTDDVNWTDLGAALTTNSLVPMIPVPKLRAVVSGFTGAGTISIRSRN